VEGLGTATTRQYRWDKGRGERVDFMPEFAESEEFHPEPLTDPGLSLSTYPARAATRRLPPSVEHRAHPVAG